MSRNYLSAAQRLVNKFGHETAEKENLIKYVSRNDVWIATDKGLDRLKTLEQESAQSALAP